MRGEVCNVQMDGPMDPASAIDYSGSYLKLEATSGEVPRNPEQKRSQIGVREP